MAEFIYQEPFPIQDDKTKYRLLTKEYVKVVECDGRKILKVDPKGLELLSKEAYADVSFYLRAAHLQKLRNILEDPEATDNDKFVAYTMLLNQVVAAEGELPTCQDTGTASASGTRARMSGRAPTMPSASPGAFTKPIRTATCAIRRSFRRR